MCVGFLLALLRNSARELAACAEIFNLLFHFFFLFIFWFCTTTVCLFVVEGGEPGL